MSIPTPLNEYFVVIPEYEEASSVLKVIKAKPEFNAKGVVVAVGPGRWLKAIKKYKEVPLEIGDMVRYTAGQAHAFKDRTTGVEYHIVNINQLIGKITDSSVPPTVS